MKMPCDTCGAIIEYERGLADHRMTRPLLALGYHGLSVRVSYMRHDPPSDVEPALQAAYAKIHGVPR